MAGILLVILGVARLGTAIESIPHSVTTGFTAGIAIIIAAQQIDTALGLRTGALHAQIFERLAEYGRHLDTINAFAVAIFGAALLILVVWPKVRACLSIFANFLDPRRVRGMSACVCQRLRGSAD